jgi:hypothetical protein
VTAIWLICVVWLPKLNNFISIFLKFNYKPKQQHLDILSSAFFMGTGLWELMIVMNFANDVYEIKNIPTSDKYNGYAS